MTILVNGVPDVRTVNTKPLTSNIIITKEDVGLGNVFNFGVTSATDDASNERYATANAVKKTYDLASGKLDATANAVSATKLQTARLIAGVPFDGTDNITINASNVGAFIAGGSTGSYVDSEGSVPWTVNSGVYETTFTGATGMVVHFKGAGSCPATQIKTGYRNGGIWYRSARDGAGFEEDWTQIYTSKHKPSANDIGALPITGGTVAGVVQINNINNASGGALIRYNPTHNTTAVGNFTSPLYLDSIGDVTVRGGTDGSQQGKVVLNVGGIVSVPELNATANIFVTGTGSNTTRAVAIRNFTTSAGQTQVQMEVHGNGNIDIATHDGTNWNYPVILYRDSPNIRFNGNATCSGDLSAGNNVISANRCMSLGGSIPEGGKVVNITDVITPVNGWTANERECVAVEYPDRYHVKGIFRHPNPGQYWHMGNWNRAVTYGYTTATMYQVPAGIEGIKAFYCEPCYRSTNLQLNVSELSWVIFDIVAVKN